MGTLVHSSKRLPLLQSTSFSFNRTILGCLALLVTDLISSTACLLPRHYNRPLKNIPSTLATDQDISEALQLSKSGVVKAYTAKAIGVKEALSWIKSKEWKDAELESDCLNI